MMDVIDREAALAALDAIWRIDAFGDGALVDLGDVRKALRNVPPARIPIGVNDRHGRPIHLGDRLRFDPREWGGPCEFTVRLRDGEISHPGTTSDLSSWCEIINEEASDG